MISVVGQAPDPPRNAELRVCSGSLDQLGHRFSLEKQEMVLGRGELCDIQLEDATASERHAMVVVRDGKHCIHDLGSASGTFVNEQRVTEDLELNPGDQITIAETTLEYLIPEPVVEVQAPPSTVTLYVDQIPRGLLESGRPVAIQLRERSGETGWTMPNAGGIPATDGAGGLGGGAAPRARVRRWEDDDEDQELTLRDVITKARKVYAFFRPHVALIALCAAVGAGLGALTYAFFPPLRKAVFEISLIPKPAENPVDRFERSNLEFFRSAQQNFRSPVLIEKTLNAMGEPSPGSARIADVQARLQLVNVMPNAYTGSFISEDPAEAIRFLETHVKLYLDTEIDKTLKVIKAEADFLQNHLTETEKELRRTESELLLFKQKNIDGLPEQARQYYDLLFELERRSSEAEREITKIKSLQRMDKERLSGEQPLIESRVLGTRPYEAALVDVNRQIAEARGRGMDVNHPEMKKLLAQAEELRRLAAGVGVSNTETERQRNPAYSSIQDTLRQLDASESSAKQEVERIQRDLKRVRSIVDRLPALEATYAELTRSYDATKALHAKIFNQLKTTQLQLELERASAAARYDIISPPTLEFVSPFKTILRRAMMLGVVGFLLGLVVATVLELRKVMGAPPPPDPPRALARIG